MTYHFLDLSGNVFDLILSRSRILMKPISKVSVLMVLGLRLFKFDDSTFNLTDLNFWILGSNFRD